MFFIVLFHFNYYEMNNWRYTDAKHIISMFCIPFFFVAVNCYVLISGYFGIKGKYNGILNLYLKCIFYSVVIYLSISLFFNNNFSIKLFFNSFLPFSHPNHLWFISSYFTLFLISPLLNYATNVLDKKPFISILLILTFLNIYMGYFWDKADIMVYTLLFIYLYLIGRFLKIHVNWEKIDLKKQEKYQSSFIAQFL